MWAKIGAGAKQALKNGQPRRWTRPSNADHAGDGAGFLAWQRHVPAPRRGCTSKANSETGRRYCDWRLDAANFLGCSGWGTCPNPMLTERNALCSKRLLRLHPAPLSCCHDRRAAIALKKFAQRPDWTR